MLSLRKLSVRHLAVIVAAAVLAWLYVGVASVFGGPTQTTLLENGHLIAEETQHRSPSVVIGSLAHLVGAVLLIIGAALWRRGSRPVVAGCLVGASFCGAYPAPLLGLLALGFAAAALMAKDHPVPPGSSPSRSVGPVENGRGEGGQSAGPATSIA